ncbi:MAG: PD-(D/E)XK nuclease family transposase [Butyrivibrio sp.]|nr:PD-(D/E)XK nuclease family transposase [Butyrivibrio sp.]
MNKKNKRLMEFFPTIRAKEQVLLDINSSISLKAVYDSWSQEEQKRFIDICTGNKGVKMLYDGYFKEILNPESDPERLSRLLSILLKRKVRVIAVLANDNSRLGDEMSLIITDIVVELDDKTIANIEVQRLGYAFLGERASCYSADLLLRQYKRLRDQSKSKFSYKEIAPVYTIVFLESSPAIFWEYPDNYIHTFFTTSDTGLQLSMLQNYIFIPVDIFIDKLHNNGIRSEIDAWLTFLGCDEPEYIVELITSYPEFKVMYDDLYNMCRNVEGVMNMFSEELQILDRNTVKYMIDEMQEQYDDLKEKCHDIQDKLSGAEAQLSDAEAQLSDTKTQLSDTKTQLSDTKTQLSDTKIQLSDANEKIAELEARLAKYEK